MSIRKMHKKKAETFTNTLGKKCVIIIFVGASKGISTPFHYTYIYKEKGKKKRLITRISRFFDSKIFQKSFCKPKFHQGLLIIASAAAHRVASQAAAASGVSPMAVM